MNVAVIQFNATANKGQNIQRALRLVRQAAGRGADFVLLPEVFHYRGIPDSRRGYQDMAESVPGTSLRPLMEEARQRKIYILAGSILEKIPGGRKAYNTSVLIGPQGRLLARYRKNHLFNAVIDGKTTNESKVFRPGTEKVIAKVGGWTAGISICFDVRFPEQYRWYAQQGAEILCVPSAFTKATGQAHWEILLRARAIENQCYVLAPNQVGRDGKGIPAYGNSMIIDPWGKILARGSGDKEQVLVARLDKKSVRARKNILGVSK
ncbi:MAG TPA: carbon-nitrogen hydrolase family protein [Candidatus Omnitrophota bacterium]|nr:carbon-nitrogen hydrolase family protein [Candidatus Omnitrophota bacterium]